MGLCYGAGSLDHQRRSHLNTWLQVVVNVLISTLLAANSCCMQRVSSPTRNEVDAAFAKGEMLDIGIPSIQNLIFICVERKSHWLGLASSALPLHFI